MRISRGQELGSEKQPPSPVNLAELGCPVTRDSELLHLPLPEIRQIVGANPEAWRLFALVTIGHLDMAIGASDDLMIRNHVNRCIAILLRLGGYRRGSPPDFSPVEIDVSQEEIAVLSNVARTTAGAVLRKLEEEGCIEQSYRRIRILAPDTLRGMLQRFHRLVESAKP